MESVAIILFMPLHIYTLILVYSSSMQLSVDFVLPPLRNCLPTVIIGQSAVVAVAATRSLRKRVYDI